MSFLSGIYDSNAIQPIIKIGENLSLWTAGQWYHYVVPYIEPMPPGPATTVDLVAIAGATNLAPGGTVAKQVVAALQVMGYEFLHLRFEPIDNVEGVLWEQAGQARFNTLRVHCRVDINSRLRDPNMSLTTFGITGVNRDVNLEARNPLSYRIPSARFIFWGNRYIVKEHPGEAKAKMDGALGKLRAGGLEAVKQYIGPTTWFPAEGRTG